MFCDTDQLNYLNYNSNNSTEPEDHQLELRKLSTMGIASRTLEIVHVLAKRSIDLLRTTTGPRVHKIILKYTQTIEFDALNSMIDHYYKKSLFEKRDYSSFPYNYEATTRLNPPIV